MFETDRCCIRKTTYRDIPDIWALYSDARVWDYLGGKRGLVRRVQGVLSRVFPGKNCLCWTVRSKDTNDFLGDISLAPHHDGLYMKISYEFLSATWGMGYASEAVGELIGHVFEGLGDERIIAETQAANAASCTMLRRLGFYEMQRLIRFETEQDTF